MCRLLCVHKFSVHLFKYQGDWLLGHLVTKLSSKMAILFCIPNAVNKCSRCFTFSLVFGVVTVLHFGLDKRCVVVSCCLNFKILNNILYRSTFSYLSPVLTSLVKYLFRHFAHFLNWVVFLFLGVICIFWTAVFYRYVSYKYFLWVCGLSSHFLKSVFLQTRSW